MSATQALAARMQPRCNERIFLSTAVIGAPLAPSPEGIRMFSFRVVSIPVSPCAVLCPGLAEKNQSPLEP